MTWPFSSAAKRIFAKKTDKIINKNAHVLLTNKTSIFINTPGYLTIIKPFDSPWQETYFPC